MFPPLRLAASLACFTLVHSSAAFGATLTLNADDRQPITGWGIFPGYSHSNWGDAFRSIANRPIVRDKLFELAVNYIRVELCSNSYDPAGPDKLNTEALDELVKHIKMGKEKGVNHWIVSVWSPPAPFKIPEDTKGRSNGQPTFYNPEQKDEFCAYYVSALAYLERKGCGLPEMISLQNEPNNVVDYDGCSFHSKADYQDLARAMRTALDARGMKAVGIGGPEGGHPGDPTYLGSGTDFWSDLSSTPISDAIMHTYGGAGWDHYQFSRAPIPKWMTEWCDIDGDNGTNAAVKGAAHIARDILNDGVGKWIYWNSYIPNAKPGSADLLYGDANAPKSTKLFHILKRLFKEVPPDGTFKVHAFKSDDPDLETGLGSDYSKLVNAIAFQSNIKTVIVMVNTTDKEKSISLAGVKATSLGRFEMSAETPFESEMQSRDGLRLTNGASPSFTIGPATVQILSSIPASLSR